MDALAGLLDGPRARRAFLLRCSLDPPWSLRVQDEAPLSVVAVLRGSAWFVPDTAAPVALGVGDVVLVRGPDHYAFADDPARPPQAVIHPDQRCTTPDGVDVEPMHTVGTHRWGNAVDGATQLLTGTYNVEGEVSRRLLDALPPHAVVRHDDTHAPLLPVLADELDRDGGLGQDAVLDRLLDLVLVHAVRAYFEDDARTAPGWFRAAADPVVGRAVTLLQDDPARCWTLPLLAREVGVSRATLARRFTEIVGAPPMQFLTEWRVTLAADLLLDPAETIASVADQVGYASAYALSAAFTRVRGVRPGAHRAARRGFGVSA